MFAELKWTWNFCFPKWFFYFGCCTEYSISLWENFSQHLYIITVNHNIQSLMSALHVEVYIPTISTYYIYIHKKNLLSAPYALYYELIVKILSCCTLLLLALFVHVRTGPNRFSHRMMITINTTDSNILFNSPSTSVIPDNIWPLAIQRKVHMYIYR